MDRSITHDRLNTLAAQLHLKDKHFADFAKLCKRHLHDKAIEAVDAAGVDTTEMSKADENAILLTLLDDITLSFMAEYGLKLWPGSGRGHLSSQSTVSRKKKAKRILFTVDGYMNANQRFKFRQVNGGREATNCESRLASLIGRTLKEYFEVLMSTSDFVGREAKAIAQGDVRDLVNTIVKPAGLEPDNPTTPSIDQLTRPRQDPRSIPDEDEDEDDEIVFLRATTLPTPAPPQIQRRTDWSAALGPLVLIRSQEDIARTLQFLRDTGGLGGLPFAPS